MPNFIKRIVNKILGKAAAEAVDAYDQDASPDPWWRTAPTAGDETATSPSEPTPAERSRPRVALGSRRDRMDGRQRPNPTADQPEVVPDEPVHPDDDWFEKEIRPTASAKYGSPDMPSLAGGEQNDSDEDKPVDVVCFDVEKHSVGDKTRFGERCSAASTDSGIETSPEATGSCTPGDAVIEPVSSICLPERAAPEPNATGQPTPEVGSPSRKALGGGQTENGRPLDGEQPETKRQLAFDLQMETQHSCEPQPLCERASPRGVLATVQGDADLLDLMDAEAPDEGSEVEQLPDLDSNVVEASDEWLFEDELPEVDNVHRASDADAFLDWVENDDEEIAQQDEPQAFGRDVGRTSPPTDNLSWRAASRAAALVDVFNLTLMSERSRTLRWLERLLIEFPHGASHAAITRLIVGGLSIDELRATADIIRHWRNDDSLWLTRVFHQHEGRWQIQLDRHRGAHLLGWTTAGELARAVADAVVAIELLTGDWRERWLHLPVGSPGHASFGSFVRSALASEPDLAGPDDGDELADACGWLRCLDPSLARAIAPDGRPPYPWSESGVLARPAPPHQKEAS